MAAGMDDAVLAAIISGSAAIGSAGLAATGTAIANKKSFKYSKQFADYQNQIALSNWNRQNEYNTPTAQMERYASAGLNPALIYGQGNNGNAGSIPQPQVSTPEWKNPFEKFNLQVAANSAIQSYYDTKAKALQYKRDEQSYEAEQYKLWQNRATMAAIEIFAADKMGRELSDLTYLHINADQFDQIRNMPYYKNLELLWQKGDINQETLLRLQADTARLNQLTTNLGMQGELLDYQTDLKDNINALFNGGDMSVGNFLKTLLSLVFMASTGRQIL